MVLGFKSQFVKPILEGTKIHTIREDKNDRWKAGNKIHFATGVRTKDYCMFKLDKCVSVQRFEIRYPELEFPSGKTFNQPKILVDGIWVNMFKIALNDGFNNHIELLDFFKNRPFKGKIIHWTDFRY